MSRGRITVDRRFRGPPDSANGGYVCGRLAAWIDGPATVRLHAPPPLDTPMDVVDTERGVALRHGETTVGEARPGGPAIDVPEAPTVAQAEAGGRAYAGFESHWFPGCFVCGPDRHAGDGLHVFAGPLAERGLVACAWTPDNDLADERGAVASPFVWAALDCPGAFSFPAPASGAILLGELALEALAPVSTGECHVVAAWEIEHDGRKHVTGSALFDASGTCLARARGVWIEVGA